MSVEKKLDSNVPADKYRLVYIIFFWLGIGTLLPWNMFITVVAYWNHKFRTVLDVVVDGDISNLNDATDGVAADSVNTTAVVADVTNTTIVTNELNHLQKAWGGYLAVASMVPNVLFLILNGAFGHNFRTQPRLLVSLILVIISFTFTSVMVQVDTDDWQYTFLCVTLASVVFININAAIFQGGILGVAGKFPPSYMGAVFSGQAVGGIFASGTNVVVLAMGATPSQSAFFCFVLSVVFLFTALIAYGVCTRTEFYKHYLGEEATTDLENDKAPEDSKLIDNSAPKIPVKVNPGLVLLKISPYAAAVFITFLVTLGCFPAITAGVVSTLDPTSAWATTFYVPVSCFLFFNIGDYVGRTLGDMIQWPKPGKIGALITLVIAICRFVFIPLFLFCNLRRGEDSLSPLLFNSDVAYTVIMLLFSISNGYIGSICMISGPQVVLPEEGQTAASLMVALLGLGLGSGAFLSNFFVKLV